MPVTLSPDIDSPAGIAVTGTIDLRAAADIVDLADVLAPGAVVIRLGSGAHLTAAAVAHLAKHLRRREVRVEATPEAAPEATQVRFLLALVGIPTVRRTGVDAGAASVAA